MGATGIFLSYKGLGTNILHLSYCHEIAKRDGPVKILTLSENLVNILKEDPLIEDVVHIDKYFKKFSDIFSLSTILKRYNFENLYIFYPSIRFFLAAKIAGIKNVHNYTFFKKKNLHLVKTAKKFTEKILKITNCPTETKLFISQSSKEIAKKYIHKNKKNIVIGAGSSGPTTKWGYNNYVSLIKKIQNKYPSFFFILAGKNEKQLANKILSEVGDSNAMTLADKEINEIFPIIACSDIYIGNDSFGQHISCQSGNPTIVLLLDTPRAYSDYSINQYQIVPEGISLNDITHDSAISPDKIRMEVVFDKVSGLL